jgi:hypothetical protein
VNIYRYGKVIKVTKKKYKEIPYVTILSNRKCNFFFLLQNWRTGGWNRSCLGVLIPVREEGGGERV